jgi:hypothetical protein
LVQDDQCVDRKVDSIDPRERELIDPIAGSLKLIRKRLSRFSLSRSVRFGYRALRLAPIVLERLGPRTLGQHSIGFALLREPIILHLFGPRSIGLPLLGQLLVLRALLEQPLRLCKVRFRGFGSPLFVEPLRLEPVGLGLIGLLCLDPIVLDPLCFQLIGALLLELVGLELILLGPFSLESFRFTLRCLSLGLRLYLLLSLRRRLREPLLRELLDLRLILLNRVERLFLGIERLLLQLAQSFALLQSGVDERSALLGSDPLVDLSLTQWIRERIERFLLLRGIEPIGLHRRLLLSERDPRLLHGLLGPSSFGLRSFEPRLLQLRLLRLRGRHDLPRRVDRRNWRDRRDDRHDSYLTQDVSTPSFGAKSFRGLRAQCLVGYFAPESRRRQLQQRSRSIARFARSMRS